MSTEWAKRKQKIEERVLLQVYSALLPYMHTDCPEAVIARRVGIDGICMWVRKENASLKERLAFAEKDALDARKNEKLQFDRVKSLQAEIDARAEITANILNGLRNLLGLGPATEPEPPLHAVIVTNRSSDRFCKIEAIKAIREVSGLGLKDSKDVVDALPGRQEVKLGRAFGRIEPYTRDESLRILRAAGVECE